MSLPGGGKGFIDKTVDGQEHYVSPSGTVEWFKWTMSENLGVPVSSLVLLVRGHVVNDGHRTGRVMCPNL
jgi:hypothetical protein